MANGRLFVLATPLGNLEDLTLGGLRILGEVFAIVAEDTRVTRKLLEHYKIAKPLLIFHQHSAPREKAKIAELLKEGKDLVLVTDAGTPGISDPGGQLIEELLKEFGQGLPIIPLPGSNAAVAALSISGFSADKFLFLGFPPHKKGRQTFFRKIAETDCTVVFYESPHRILKTLQMLVEIMPERPLVIARELTKKFETIYRGTANEILSRLTNDQVRGEFTVVVKAW